MQGVSILISRKLLIHNTPSISVGRAWITWNRDGLEVDVIKINMQSIDCVVNIRENQCSFFLAGVYGFNERDRRFALWKNLTRFAATVVVNPWIIRETLIELDINMKDLGETWLIGLKWRILISVLIPCRFKVWLVRVLAILGTIKGMGCFYSDRIDRYLINDGWSVKYPNFEVETLPPSLSDHCPIVVTVNWSQRRGHKPFKFFDYWMRNDKVRQILQESWQ